MKSRNNIPAPYAIHSRARSPAEGDGFMPDRDKEMAMLEEAAKNVPVFNLPTLPKMWVILQPVIFLTGICSQTQPTEHDATAAKESYTRSLPHSTSGVLPAQGSTTFISNPAPLHAASSISSPGIPFSYDTPSANFNVKGHVNPPVPRSCKSMMGR